MANNPSDFQPGPAAEAVVSLSQAILAPLDALAKAQVHAARSFLSFVLQMGFPSITPPAGEGAAQADSEKESTAGWLTKFAYGEGDKRVEVQIPTLALLPLQPLSIESAEYAIELSITHIEPHRQEGESGKRPWYLVKDPLSIRGTLSGPQGGDDTSGAPNVRVSVKVGRLPTPDGLSRLISAQSQTATATPKSESGT